MSKKTRKPTTKKKTPTKRKEATAKRSKAKRPAPRSKPRKVRVYSKADLKDVLDPKCLKSPLCRARLSKGMSRAVLSKKSGLSEECIRNIELRGASPQLRTLSTLAKALDVQVAKLVA
jgi:ribosome-binding protein aMBF1 (putative translation factor)